ncbi:unnamed protein product [Mycena citricolor]|uniref:Polysaccharide lyase 14 domain-containing protein n=1 Tax=Mycena citricolor TaxID=2018698 RepID=A0AAD2HZ45_9AGAR|nr:unnamed protein product [Mycena citricolor]
MAMHLIPDSIHAYHSAFTTCPALASPRLPLHTLDDADLGVHNVTSRTTHRLVAPPDSHTGSDSDSEDSTAPARAWEAVYPAGSINPSGAIPGGFGFYVAGAGAFAPALEGGAQHVVVSYRMMLQGGWEWVKGGKLPGIFGGDGKLSYACTGGRKDNRCKCFNIRPMWRANGQGELYTYLPLTDHNRERQLAVPPTSKANPDYGFSLGRGAFNFDVAVGRWATVAFRLKLNTVGSEDGCVHLNHGSPPVSHSCQGELEFWINGRSVIKVTGLMLRDSEASRIKGAHFQTFFGGHTEDWASPKEQKAWFADVTGLIVE